jgi:hypothetical protein
MNQPKNVQAVIDWTRENAPHQLTTVELSFSEDKRPYTVFQALLLLGFEAGRKFEREHPDVEPASELLKRILAERKKKWEAGQPSKKCNTARNWSRS